MTHPKEILVGGEWCATDEAIVVNSPFTGELLAEVSSAGPGENDEAVAHAERAVRELSDLPRFELARGLRAIANGIEARRELFAETIAKESAKPIKPARGEADRAIATFNWAAGEAERFVGEVVPVDAIANGRGKSGHTIFVPRGLVYGITPFNFPLNLVAHKVAPALASRNAIIIKPSPRTPLTALLLGEVFLESGFPSSALQIVPTDTKNLDAIYDDKRVKMISFTGSAEVGWAIKARANKKFVTLELGGSAPVIVDESADVDDSLKKTLSGAFAFSGQVCISVQRVYIHEKLFDEWTSRFVAFARKLKRGDPLDEKTELSVMIDEAAAKRAKDWVDKSVDNGAKILCGNNRDSAFLDATVVTNTTSEMRVVSDEVFAPVVVVEKFSEFREAVNLANNTKFGLQVGVFTNDLRNLNYAATHLEFGGVIVNDVPTFRVDNMPYGGVKESGFGREGVRYAMEEMCERRMIVVNS